MLDILYEISKIGISILALGILNWVNLSINLYLHILLLRFE